MGLKRRRVSERIDLFFPPAEEETAELLQAVVARCVPLLRETWGLAPPRRLLIYVMTDWRKYLVHATPWYAWVPAALLLPVWAFRIRRMWPLCAGWTQRFKGRPTIGLKPPRLIAQADRSVGKLLFFEEPDPVRKFEHVTCHELTHAFTAHLRLPLWLNEGIAMLSVDRHSGRSTVRPESLGLLTGTRGAVQYGRLQKMHHRDIARQYARGYWLSRLLKDTHPEIIRSLLERRNTCRAIERRVAAALDLDRRSLWPSVDEILTAHFAATAASGAGVP